MPAPTKSATRGTTNRNPYFKGASDVLNRTFKDLLSCFGPSALVLPEGEALFVSSDRPQDLATLPSVAALCHRYLKLQDGDVAIANDPYNGGTVLSDFTLTMGVRLEPGAPTADLLLAVRLCFPEILGGKGKLDDEGVRVPPTPLATSRQLNRELMAAIAAHPMAPRGLASAVGTALESMAAAADRLKRLAAEPSAIVSQAGFRSYLTDSSRTFAHLMTRLPLGSIIVTSQFASGEQLKLQLKITEDRLSFDFGGSDGSARIALTELATLGACEAAVFSAFGEAVPLNSGSFEHIEVSAPARTLLSASAPLGTVRGMSEGVATVARLAYEALSKLSVPLKIASSAGANGRLKISFADKPALSFEVPHGAGAAARFDGPVAFGAWAGNPGFPPDVEALEREYPVRFLAAGERAPSGGAGRHRGGHGTTLGLELLSPAQVEWLDPSLGRRHEGFDSGRAGHAASLEVLRAGSGAREEHATAHGSLALEAGDQVFFLTSGGGGFGAAGEDDAEDAAT